MWHYTPRCNLEGIMEAGALLPASPAHAPQSPALYFTTATDVRLWVIGVLHQIGDAKGRWLRFGYEDSRLFPIAVRGTRDQIASSSLPSSEIDVISRWRKVLRPIAIDEFSIIEATDDDGETWRNVWTNPHRGGGILAPTTKREAQCKP